MKKSFIYTLIVALTLCCCLSSVSFAETTQIETNATVTISDAISIYEKTGLKAGGSSGWGNHESRLVHTSHGDYLGYCTEEISPDQGYLSLTSFAIFKVADDGSVTTLLEDYRGRESSGVTIFADNDENVWLVEIGDSRIRSAGDSGVHMTAYRVDAKTDEVMAYSATYTVKQYGSGFGYGSAAYDPATNKIIAETADGDPSYGDEFVGTIEWFIFDCDTLQWDSTYHQIQVGNRYCYPYIAPDGKGGMYIIAGRDFRCTSAGYPEIGDHDTDENGNAINWKEKNSLAKKYSGYNQSAGYVWDSIYIFYIPDYNVDEFSMLCVEEPDYSMPDSMSQSERYKMENRAKNWYPNFQNNNGGDVYIDSEGYLHIIWYKMYLYAALTRAEADNMYYHDVYDIRNITSADQLDESCRISRSEIKNGVKDGKSYSFRLYEDADGNLFYISGSINKSVKDDPLMIKGTQKNTSAITVYQLEGTPQTGYTFKEVSSISNGSADYIVNISNRGSTIKDGTIATITINGSDYSYRTIDIDVTYTGKEVEAPAGVTIDTSAFEEGTTVSIDYVSNAEEIDGAFAAIGKEISNAVILDFSAKVGTRAVQPNGKVQVSIEIPTGMDASKAELYYIDGEKAEKIACTVSNGILTAELDHFSIYALIEEKSEVIEPTTTPTPSADKTPAPEKTTEPKGEGDGMNTTTLLIIIAAAVVVIAVVLSVVIAKAKKKNV